MSLMSAIFIFRGARTDFCEPQGTVVQAVFGLAWAAPAVQSSRSFLVDPRVISVTLSFTSFPSNMGFRIGLYLYANFLGFCNKLLSTWPK